MVYLADLSNHGRYSADKSNACLLSCTLLDLVLADPTLGMLVVNPGMKRWTICCFPSFDSLAILILPARLASSSPHPDHKLNNRKRKVGWN